jgi:hypothetical protein
MTDRNEIAIDESLSLDNQRYRSILDVNDRILNQT